MNVDNFAQQIEAVGRRVARLHGRAEELPLQQQQLLAEACEDLERALEQLQLAEEELHQQNEELAAAREDVEAERQRYQDLFEFAPDGYLVTDAAGRILEANRAAAELLKLSQRFLVGKTLSMFVAESERQVFDLELTQVQLNQVQERTIRLCPYNGVQFDAALSIAAVCNREGKQIALRVCVRDITERKQVEELLRQQSEQARILGLMCDRIRQSLDLGEILNTTVAEVRQFLTCDRVLIYRFQPDWSGVVVVESVGSDWTPMLTTTIRDTQFQDYVSLYEQGQIYAVDDIYTAGLDEFYINLLAQFHVRANLVVPILQVRSQESGLSTQESEKLLDSDSNIQPSPEQSEQNPKPKTELWGLLIAHHCAAPRQWQSFEIDLLSSLATQVAIAIQQAQLYRQTQQQAQREQALNRFTSAIRSSLDLETIFATATQEISQLLHVDRVEIYQYLPERQIWLTVVDYRQRPDLPNSLGLVIPDVENEINRHLKRLEVARIDDTNTLEDGVLQLTQGLTGAWLLVPLHFQNILWGSLSLMISGRTYQWQDSEVELVSAIATQLAIAIQQAQLYQQLSAVNTDLERQVKERTAELQQKIQELQELNILKDDFLSTVSHELRTPLANMKMAIEMLKIAGSPERQQLYLEICQAECNREADLINDLLDLQRLEAASYPISSKEAVNLQDWLPNIVEPFLSRIQESQQTLKVNLPPKLPPVISDGAGLARVLVELLNNACKYTPAGGEIVLCVCYQPEPKITIFTISNQAEIPAAALSRIFEKFYRVPHADPWKQGGTGLGLALVQKLVEQLGGTIQVESGGGWTKFTLQLPGDGEQEFFPGAL